MGSTPTASPGARVTPLHSCVDGFGASFVTYAASRSGHVAAAVYDDVGGRTRCYHARESFDTASVVKVAIMGAVLRSAQLEHRSPTAGEESLMSAMIEASDNDAATALWNEVGGPDGMTAFFESARLASTVVDPGGHWGLTRTTAPDQVALLDLFAFPNPLLDAASRGRGLALMRSVIPADRWGVSAGVPDGVSVALKNGWLPIAPGDWVVGSVGFVVGEGRRYVIALLSDGSPTFQYGVETLEHLSTLVWAGMAPGS